MRIKAFTQLLGYSIGILVPADLLHVCDTKQVQLIGFGYRWDKSKAVAKERSCKVAFRTRCYTSLCSFSHCPQQFGG